MALTNEERTSRETPEMEAAGWQMLTVQMERFAALERRFEAGALKVVEGSEMWRDDQVEDYDPPSNLARGLIHVAHDHLNAIRTLVYGSGHDDGILPAMAGYTLLRTVVEACGVGLWMRSGGRRDKRVFYALRLLTKHRADADVWAKGQNLHNAKGAERQAERLLGILNSTSRRGSDLTSFPKTSDVLREIGRLVPKGDYTPLSAWQAMSGIAHANRAVMLALLERVPLPTGDHEYTVTSSAYIFAQMFTVALDCMETLVDLYEKQATTIEPGRRGKR